MSDVYLSLATVMVPLVHEDGPTPAARHNPTSQTLPIQVPVVGAMLEGGESGPGQGAVIGAVLTARRWRDKPCTADPGALGPVAWIGAGRPPRDCHPCTGNGLESPTTGQAHTPLPLPAAGGMT
ncbi:NUDIX hydrolase [Streptomyces sp. NPDC091280]|uniref:NUDIX hydrolase n=1 Tax=Streptomyces sp. NPDC091280 TaxID=3365984 RepID=UPI003800D49F